MQIASNGIIKRAAYAVCLAAAALSLLSQAASVRPNTARALTHPSQTEKAHARLWRELRPLLAAHDETAARALVSRDASASRALYLELLFESATSRLYDNPRLPYADEARTLLAVSGEETRALEAKFAEWAKNPKPGVGFAAADAGWGQILYLAQIAKLRDEEKDAGKDAPAGTGRELTERALALSETAGSELAVASFSATLAFYALREKRLDDVLPLVERSEKIWEDWAHPVGLYQAPLILGIAAYNGQKWSEAAGHFARAAERAQAVPELLPNRVSALSDRAAALRNAGDKEGVLDALTAAVADQRKVLAAVTEKDARLKESKALASFEVQTGGALAALGRHVEASDWYVRAEALKKENYEVEKVELEAQIAARRAQFQSLIDAAESEERKKLYRQTLETITDTMLSQMDTAASLNNDHATVLKIAERRLALARAGGNPVNVAEAWEKVANAQRKGGDLAKARAAALEALRLRQSDPRRTHIYETLSLLGDIASYAEDWNEAVARYEEVIAAAQPGALPPPFDLGAEKDAAVNRVRARMNDFDRLIRVKSALDAKLAISSVRSRQGDYRAADALLGEVEQGVPALYATGAPDEADLLKWMGENPNPNLTAVEVYAHRRQAGFTPDKEDVERFGFAELAVRSERGSVLHYRAMLYEDQNDLERAAQAYEQGNTLTASLVGGSFTLSGTYVALARIERARGNYEAAEAPVAAALAEAVRNNEPDDVANMLGFQSILRREEGKLEESQKLAEDALKIARKLDSRTLLAGSLRTLGRTEALLGGTHLKQSEQHLRESIALWRELGLQAHAAYTLDGLGQTLEALKRDDEALAAYVEAVRIVEGMVGSLPATTSAETFSSGRGNRELYDHLVKLLIRKGRASDALQYLERSKSKSLVDALAGASVNSKDPALNALLGRVRGSSDAVRLAEKELADELARPADARDAAKIAALQSKTADARKGYVAAVAELKRTNPSYASLVAVNPTDLAELRKRLPEKTVLLSYFPTDTDLYIFILTRDREPTARAVGIKRADLTRLVGEYRALVVPQEQSRGGVAGSARKEGQTEEGEEVKVSVRGLGVTETLTGAGVELKRDLAATNRLTARLYDTLFAPARDEIERADTILLVPAGELYYLPMHALGRARADGSIEYLIESKRFAYLASADLLNAVSGHAAAAGGLKSGALLALGNPDGSLPGASQEVAALSHIFTQSEVYTGAQATVARVSETDGGHTPYVHFATHGIINSRDPKESYLLLAGEPGRLSVRDLVEDTYKLSFEGTRLVTLSACNTNIGGFDPGAAYGSLSRAFSKAGAPTVIASLWSVDDNSTRDTMTVFYRELIAGTPKAEALRRAQLSVLHDPRYAHPFFWAPFVMLGEWR